MGCLFVGYEYKGFRRGVAHEREWRRELDSRFTQHIDATGQISFERDTLQRLKYLSDEYKEFCKDAEAARPASQMFWWRVGRNTEERKGVEKEEKEFGAGKESMIEEHHVEPDPANEKFDG